MDIAYLQAEVFLGYTQETVAAVCEGYVELAERLNSLTPGILRSAPSS